MVVNITVLVVFFAATILMGFLALRSWRVRNVFVKVVVGLLSSLLTLVLGAVSIFALMGIVKFLTPLDVQIPDVTVAGTPEQVARGEYLANSFCTGCHSATLELPLTGGVDLGKDLPMPLGSFVSVNLTPAGPLQDWSDGEIFRALRNGVAKNGRRLVLMSTVRARNMSDEDTLAVIAYLRSQPAVENVTQDPPDQPNFLAAVMFGAGMLPAGNPPFEGVITAPTRGATVDYGEYIVSYQDCRDCHGEDLTGGAEGQLGPIGPNLRVVKGWTQAEFITTLRTGVDPSGHELKPELMPWKSIGRMDDMDLTAIYMYLTSLQ